MPTTMTVKGQVTIPKHLRDALGLKAGSRVTFAVNESGEVVLTKASPSRRAGIDRFEAALGIAEIPWRTDDLMALLRGK